jgi:putative spermidine/putrescine transport system permease protein
VAAPAVAVAEGAVAASNNRPRFSRFDEIIVTTFTAGTGVTTLPIWILDNLFRPNQAPIVNVIAVVLVLVSIIPIYFAQRLAGSDVVAK